jgi:hypothetical protein
MSIYGSTFDDPKNLFIFEYVLENDCICTYALNFYYTNGMPYTHTQGIGVLSNPRLATQHLVLV